MDLGPAVLAAAADRSLSGPRAKVAAGAKDAANFTLILGLIIQPIVVIHVTNVVTTTGNLVANADQSSTVSQAFGDIAATLDAPTAEAPRAMAAAVYPKRSAAVIHPAAVVIPVREADAIRPAADAVRAREEVAVHPVAVVTLARKADWFESKVNRRQRSRL